MGKFLLVSDVVLTMQWSLTLRIAQYSSPILVDGRSSRLSWCVALSSELEENQNTRYLEHFITSGTFHKIIPAGITSPKQTSIAGHSLHNFFCSQTSLLMQTIPCEQTSTKSNHLCKHRNCFRSLIFFHILIFTSQGSVKHSQVWHPSGSKRKPYSQCSMQEISLHSGLSSARQSQVSHPYLSV